MSPSMDYLIPDDELNMENVHHVLSQDDKIPGPTALHVACEHGFVHIVSKLLQLGARVDSPADFGFTPLHTCAVNHQYACCELILQHVATSLPSSNFSPPPSPFTSHTSPNNSPFLLQTFSPTRLSPFQHDPFDVSSSSSSSQMNVLDDRMYCDVKVRSLPLLGALLSATTKQRRTAVHCAVRSGDSEMVAMLLKMVGNCGGCEALHKFHLSNSTSHTNSTAHSLNSTDSYHVPSSSSSSSSSSQMIDYSKSATSEHVKESMTQEELRKSLKNEIILIEKKGRTDALYCFVNACDDQGFGVLHDASKRGDSDVVRILLSCGAKPELKARGSNRTAAEIALEYNHIHVCELINQYAAAEGKTDWAAGRLRGLYDTKVKTPSETWHFLS